MGRRGPWLLVMWDSVSPHKAAVGVMTLQSAAFVAMEMH